MMTALLLTNDFPPLAGGEATWYGRLCASLPPERVLVLAPRVRADRSFDARQLYRIYRRRVPLAPHVFARLTQMALFCVHTAGIVRRERICAVHVGHLYLVPVALVVKALLGVPYVIYLHAGEMARYMRARLVRRLVRAMVQRASRVVMNSTYTRRHYDALGIAHACTEVVSIGVDIERFRPDVDGDPIRRRYGLTGVKVILTVGRLIERKGHDMVIRALRRVQRSVGPVRYLIVGTGPEEERLRSLARVQDCAGAVVFAGHVSEDDLPRFYAACDVFAMPSRALAARDGIEGFGVVFLEAGACGKPVIGGRSGGVADAVADGTTGLLADPTDVDQLAEALIRLLSSPSRAKRMGKQGRLRAVQIASGWHAAVERVWSAPGQEAERLSPARVERVPR